MSVPISTGVEGMGCLAFFLNQARRKLKDKDLAVLGRQTAAHPQLALPQIRFLFI